MLNDDGSLFFNFSADYYNVLLYRKLLPMSDNKSQILNIWFYVHPGTRKFKGHEWMWREQSQGIFFSVGHVRRGLGKEKYASPSDISRPHHDPGYGGSPMLDDPTLILIKKVIHNKG